MCRQGVDGRTPADREAAVTKSTERPVRTGGRRFVGGFPIKGRNVTMFIPPL
jgi:hypothetical protein